MDLLYVELSCPAVYLNRHSGFGNLAYVSAIMTKFPLVVKVINCP